MGVTHLGVPVCPSQGWHKKKETKGLLRPKTLMNSRSGWNSSAHYSSKSCVLYLKGRRSPYICALCQGREAPNTSSLSSCCTRAPPGCLVLKWESKKEPFLKVSQFLYGGNQDEKIGRKVLLSAWKLETVCWVSGQSSMLWVCTWFHPF